MTEDKNTTTDEPTYTRVLSRIFSSFAGYSTLEEYKAALKGFLWGPILIGVLISILFLCPSTKLSILIASIIVFMLIPIAIVSFNNWRIVVRRYHVFGMSYTCFGFIPFAVLLIICGSIFYFYYTSDKVVDVIGYFCMIYALYRIWIEKKLRRFSDWDKAKYFWEM